MPHNTVMSFDRARTLLRDQLTDLTRYRLVTESQETMLRAGDSMLFEIFAREADGLAADIQARETHLATCRTFGAKWPDEVGGLADRVEAERNAALAAGQRLSEAVTREAAQLAASLRDSANQVDQLLAGYPRQPRRALASSLDRTA
jgi:hypothetical protein